MDIAKMDILEVDSEGFNLVSRMTPGLNTWWRSAGLLQPMVRFDGAQSDIDRLRHALTIQADLVNVKLGPIGPSDGGKLYTWDYPGKSFPAYLSEKGWCDALFYMRKLRDLVRSLSLMDTSLNEFTLEEVTVLPSYHCVVFRPYDLRSVMQFVPDPVKPEGQAAFRVKSAASLVQSAYAHLMRKYGQTISTKQIELQRIRQVGVCVAPSIEEILSD